MGSLVAASLNAHHALEQHTRQANRLDARRAARCRVDGLPNPFRNALRMERMPTSKGRHSLHGLCTRSLARSLTHAALLGGLGVAEGTRGARPLCRRRCSRRGAACTFGRCVRLHGNERLEADDAVLGREDRLRQRLRGECRNERFGIRGRHAPAVCHRPTPPYAGEYAPVVLHLPPSDVYLRCSPPCSPACRKHLQSAPPLVACPRGDLCGAVEVDGAQQQCNGQEARSTDSGEDTDDDELRSR